MNQSSFSRQDLLDCSEGKLFGEGNSRLPAPNMLMMDRIVEINADGGEHGKGFIHAELDINPDLWFFDCHFKGDPVMPGCLGLDAMWQLVGFYLGWSGGPGRGRALGVGEVKLFMGVGNGRVEVDGRPIYTAKDLKVGLFTDTTTF